MIIAIDFDGTIVKHKYPEIGDPIPGAIETIKALQKNGHKVFLWTMRGSNKVYNRNLLAEAVDYLQLHGIELCGINNSPAQFSTSKKQYAQIYIDDAALGCPLLYPENDRPYVNWKKIGEYLMAEGVMNEKQYNEIFFK